MQFLLDYEYPFTIFLALGIFFFFVPKRKYFYISAIISFLLVEIYWHYRPLPGPLDYLMIYGFMIASLFLFFKANIYTILFIITTTFCVQHISYKLTMSLCMLINPTFRGSAFYLVFIVFFIALINLIIYFLFLRKYKNDKDISINNYLLLFIAVMMLLVNIVISYYVEEPLLVDEKYGLYALINLYAIITSVLGIFILFMSSREKKLKDENEVLEIILKNDEKRYELAKASQEEINIKYHDLKHYIKEKKLPEDEALEIEENGKIFQSIYFTGNKALDAILLEKNKECFKSDIQFLTMADGKLLDFMNVTHVYSLFANLLDNAIESELKIQDKNNRLIRLRVNKEKNNVIIKLENSCFEKPLFKDGLPLSTKEDKKNHGFGTKSIERIVSLYHGYVNFSYKDNIFYVKIAFPMK